MPYPVLGNRDHQQVAAAMEQVISSLNTRLNRMHETLMKMFDGKVVGGIAGVSIERSELPHVFIKVTTPAGVARLRKEPVLRGGYLCYQLSAERLRFDHKDEAWWEPLWDVTLEQNGMIQVDANRDSGLIHDDGNDLFKLIVALHYSQVSGPL